VCYPCILLAKDTALASDKREIHATGELIPFVVALQVRAGSVTKHGEAEGQFGCLTWLQTCVGLLQEMGI
jgi:hypothetical protein